MKHFVRSFVPSHLYIAILAGACILGNAAQAQDTLPDLPFDVVISDATEDDEAAHAVAAARAEWLKAFAAQDLERMLSFYVDHIYSYDLMAAPTEDGLGMAFDGAAAWRENWVSFFAMFEEDLVISIDELTIYQQGNLATVRGLTRLEGTVVDGPYVDMWVRETNVLERVNDRWLVLHDHVSVPFDFTTGQALTGLAPPEG